MGRELFLFFMGLLSIGINSESSLFRQIYYCKINLAITANKAESLNSIRQEINVLNLCR